MASSIVHTIKLVADAKKAADDIRLYKGEIVATAQTVKRYEATLNGDQILRAANNWTAAVAKLGGASRDAASAEQMLAGVARLTAAEKQKLNTTLQEAIEKYRVLGQQAPSAMQQLEQATRRVSTEVEKIPSTATSVVGSLKSTAGAFGLAFSAAAVIGFGRQVFATAGQIKDLSEKLGVSAEAVQRWKYAAEQGGATIDTVNTAVSFMNKTLAGDGSSITGALKLAGLSFDAIRQMKPEEAFNAIVESIEKIENPMTKARVSYELFGRSGQELLPAILAGFKQIGDGAGVMRDETVDRLAEAEDAWERLRNTAVTYSGELIAFLMTEFSKENPVERFFKDAEKSIRDTFRILNLDTNAARKDLQDLGQWFDVLRGKMDGMPRIAAPQLPRGAPLRTIRLSPDEIAAIEADLNRQRDVLDKAAKAGTAYAQSVRALANELSGAKLSAEVKKLSDATALLTAEQRRSPEVMKRVADAALKLQRQGADLTPELFNIALASGRISDSVGPVREGLEGLALNTLPSVATGANEVAAAIKMMNLSMGQAKELTSLPGWQIDPPKITKADEQILAEAAKRVQALEDDLKQTALQLGYDIASLLAEGIRTGDWSQFENDLAVALSTAMGSAMAAGIDFFAPGVGTMLQPLLTAISEKFLGALGLGTRGRALVQEFAASLGGFDALREKLNALGDEGERLWRQLTQGVGSNNPQQAQAAIDAITAALDRNQAALAETKNRVTELIQAHLGAGTQIPPALQASIDKLIEMKVLTAENAAEMLSLVTTIPPTLAQVQSAADTLGVSMTGIGDTIAAMPLMQKANDAVAAFQTLEAAGADMLAVYEQAATKIQPMVDEAIKFGRELPDSMRPYIQAMIDAGLLTDANGQKLTDISGINFAEPLTKKLDDLIAKIMELIDALAGPNGAAKTLEDLGRTRIQPIRIPYYFDQEGGTPGGGSNGSGPNGPRPREFANGTNGFEYFNPAGEWVKLHGWEKVTPLGKEGSAGGGSVSIQINNPSIREDRDIDALTESMVDRLRTLRLVH